ncbi:hypothetical protein SASPL_117539 [Salvia splendens]|uniref:Ribosomal RNA-processing protein 7 C-terminal domain-containing protein n=1 Tax=Salvia splendens TaxID=180675 RepID=A0A8X8XZX3_SALSN|nr:hypothetical protein SASPL_117539 [Salvia splendens]
MVLADATPAGKKQSQKLSDKKRKKSRPARRDAESIVPSLTNDIEDTIPNREPSKANLLKQSKKKRKNVDSISRFDESNDKKDASEECNVVFTLTLFLMPLVSSLLQKDVNHSIANEWKLMSEYLVACCYWMADSIPGEQFSISGRTREGDAARNTKKGKSKHPERKKKKRQLVSNHILSDNLLETREENLEDKSRPGLEVLQERIDDFIMAHEAREEQAKAERLAPAAEGGWTVGVHQKGRKKSTEAESGIAVGSVAQAAVLDKMGKKKKKEVGLDFYQFNRREAHRNEIMMLQSKFPCELQGNSSPTNLLTRPWMRVESPTVVHCYSETVFGS